MDDSLKHIDHQMDKNRAEAADARLRADIERNKASNYTNPGEESQKQLYSQEAQRLDDKADLLETENQNLAAKRTQIEARVTELKAERERINREVVDRTFAIDKELSQLTGSMTI